MNKTYEIEYHIDADTLTREVLTADGRSARQNRLPVPLIEYAERQARFWQAYRYEIRLVKLPHIMGDTIQIGVGHLVYTGRVDENC